MVRVRKGVLLPAVVLLAMLIGAAPAAAQTVTTGNLAGTVSDQQGGVLPGATVVAVHDGTGTSYQAVSQADGRFSILNVRVGSYTIKVTMPSFKDAEQKDVVVSLGEERAANFKLQLATVAETVVVTAETSPIDLSRAGAGGNIGNEIKETLPTISRSLTDVVRTNSYFNPMGANEDTPTASVAGRSQRYNNLQIDGAVNNDLFGLAAGGGVPGGAAGTQPISLDAIQEVQLVVSPYDIRQSGFSGGGINAITKTGTNQFHGTVFFFGRNQDWVGEGVTGVPISTFKDTQAGFSIGGPIAQNKAFFFSTFDYGRKKTPSGFSVGGTGVDFGNEALVDRFLSILKNNYAYDLGPNAKDEVTRKTDNDKIFLRADFNVGQSQLTLRHNYVDAINDSGFPSTTIYTFIDGFQQFKSKTNSTVGQLTTRLGSGVNELRLTRTAVRESRNPQPGYPARIPFVDVTLTGAFRATAGLSGSSQRNQLDQDIVELTDDYTRVFGKHQLTIGTHNEFFKFRNLFINGADGTYSFASLDLFEQGLAQAFTHAFSNTSDPNQAAEFRVNHFGFYAGDQWRIMPRLTLTYGARLDIVRYPDKPNANPAAEETFGYATDVVPNNTFWSPRGGFNYALRADASEQIRGGIGLFSGRTPYVWISNQYGNTGVDFTRLNVAFNAAQRVPFVRDPDNQPTSLPGVGAAINEIDVIDPEFKYPSVMRANLAYDRKLPWGWYGTVEYLYTNTVQDVRYENLNLQQVNTLPFDARPVYARRVTTLSDVMLLTNSSDGTAWTINFEAKRPFSNGFFVSAAYLYGESRSTMDGVRDQAVSQWGNVYVPGDPNHPPLARSDYDPGQRITLSSSYDFRLWKSVSATASVFYSGQSGRPYTLLWGSPGVNGDNQTLNDNLFLPGDATGLTFTNGTYDQLRAYLDQRECTSSQIGQIMERNSCRAPWNNTFDGRFAVKLPYKKVSTEITLDVLNILNLLDSSNGQFRYANFNDIVPVTPVQTAGITTGMNLSTLNNPNFTEFVRSDLRSRWQMQLGGRLRF